jgi:hypothetical protein
MLGVVPGSCKVLALMVLKLISADSGQNRDATDEPALSGSTRQLAGRRSGVGTRGLASI